jgi:uncharacterized protein (TIGR02271 family)
MVRYLTVDRTRREEPVKNENYLKNRRVQYPIPVLEEELKVGKRRVETGSTKVSIGVREIEEVIEQPLIDEKVEVTRVAIDRFIDRPAETRTEGEVTIVPVMEEVLVVEKKLRLKEELHIIRTAQTRVQTHKDTLYKEEVTVEHTDLTRGKGNSQT